MLLTDVAGDILSMEDEDQDLIEPESSLDKAFLYLSLQIRRLLSYRPAHASTKEQEWRQTAKDEHSYFQRQCLELEHILAAI